MNGESEPLCIDCGEELASNPNGRCSECDIDYLLATWPRCECGAQLFNDIGHELGFTEDHAPGCAKAAGTPTLYCPSPFGEEHIALREAAEEKGEKEDA